MITIFMLLVWLCCVYLIDLAVLHNIGRCVMKGDACIRGVAKYREILTFPSAELVDTDEIPECHFVLDIKHFLSFHY